MEYHFHPIDRGFESPQIRHSSLRGLKTETTDRSSKALKQERIMASDGMNCPIRGFPHHLQNSSLLATVTRQSKARMTSFLFQSLTTKNCSRWERSSAVFAWRMTVITLLIFPSRRHRQTSRLNLNFCRWFEIIAMMHEITS
jgi:hypothetical protein